MFAKKLKNFLEQIKDKNPEKTKIDFDKLYEADKDPWQTKIWDRRLSFIFNSFLRNINLNKKTVLDIGCSYGDFLKMILEKNPEVKPYGIDIAKRPIEKLKKEKGKINVKRADIKKFPYGDSYFDAVFCLEVLYYLKDEEKIKAIKEVTRVLKNGGLFLLGVTFGRHYFLRGDEILNLTKKDYFLKKKKILLPKPLPISFPLFGEIMLHFSKFLPPFFNLKIYYLFVKINENCSFN